MVTSHMASAERGVSSAGFRTTVQPTAIAAHAFLVIIAFGKFHWKIYQLSYVVLIPTYLQTNFQCINFLRNSKTLFVFRQKDILHGTLAPGFP